MSNQIIVDTATGKRFFVGQNVIGDYDGVVQGTICEIRQDFCFPILVLDEDGKKHAFLWREVEAA